MTSLDRLLRILNLLRKSDITYALEHRRGECLAVCFKLVSLPLELEFYSDKVSVHYGERDARDAILAALTPRQPAEAPPLEVLITHLAA